MKTINDHLQNFFESNDKDVENFQILNDLLKDQKILENRHEFKAVLYMIAKISNNFSRNSYFINKIEKIIDNYKDQIKNNFTNSEIFDIFYKNKRILLFLIENKVVNVDKTIYNKMRNYNYLYYFYPEIKNYTYQEFNEDFEERMPENYEEKRHKGENDLHICSLIRSDSVSEFVTYVNQTNFPLSDSLESSFFETNWFLVKQREVSLIEYAAFYGSIQIFNYLRLNKCDLTSSLWLYSIHGRNAQIIHLLEENKIEPPNKNYMKCLKEAIKCHHNEIAIYILNYLLQDKEGEKISSDFFPFILSSYNFSFVQDSKINYQDFFYFLCKYDHFIPVETLLNNTAIDVNAHYDYKDI